MSLHSALSQPTWASSALCSWGFALKTRVHQLVVLPIAIDNGVRLKKSSVERAGKWKSEHRTILHPYCNFERAKDNEETRLHLKEYSFWVAFLGRRCAHSLYLIARKIRGATAPNRAWPRNARKSITTTTLEWILVSCCAMPNWLLIVMSVEKMKRSLLMRLLGVFFPGTGFSEYGGEYSSLIALLP